MTKEEQVIETIRKGPGMSPNEYQRLALRTASKESMENLLLNSHSATKGEPDLWRSPKSWYHAKIPAPPISAIAVCALSSGMACTPAGIGRKATRREPAKTWALFIFYTK